MKIKLKREKKYTKPVPERERIPFDPALAMVWETKKNHGRSKAYLLVF